MKFKTLIKHSLPTVQDYVNRLSKTPQGTTWHPEGNVLIHTKIVFNRALESNDIDIILTAYFHDLGKVDTTESNGRGGYSAHDHERVSADLVKYSNHSIQLMGGNTNVVHWLVLNHMRVKYLETMSAKKRKALEDHIWFDKLDYFKDCDNMRTLNIFEVIKAGGNPFLYIYNKYIKKSRK